MRILIIDDTKSVHAFVKGLLAKAPGIEVHDVFNGEEALALLSKDSSFDLIFLDWEMPVRNGPDTLKEIRGRGYSVPVLMMTTKNAPEDILRMLEGGASEYLMKPFTADILFEKMEFVLGKAVPHAA